VAADRLVLEGMQFFGYHGDVEAERALGSRLYVDVELVADLSVAGRSDELADTLDYTRCYGIVRDVIEKEQHRLLEAVADRIAAALLAEPRAQSVRVRVAKHPPMPGTLERVAVVLTRERSTA
jgi:dihydroneopterin aldolase